jgi:hypothetical protein
MSSDSGFLITPMSPGNRDIDGFNQLAEEILGVLTDFTVLPHGMHDRWDSAVITRHPPKPISP